MHRLVKWRIFYSAGLVSLAACIYLAAFQGMWPWLLASLIYCKLIVILGAYVGHHRYFAHSSFKTTEFKHKVLCWLSFFSAIGSPIDWFITHNHHHIQSDKKFDLHSPLSGFWTSMIWNLRGTRFFERKNINMFPKKLYKNSTVRFIHNNYFLLWIIIGTIVALIDWRIFLFFIMMPVGVNNLLITFVGVIMHIKLPGSYRNFDTGDYSYNNKLISLFLLAEGMHNNHHKNPTNYRHNALPGEFDLAGFIIEKFFLVESKK